MKKPLERDIQKAIVAALRARGIFVLRLNTGGIPLHGRKQGLFRPPETRGVADLLVVRMGRADFLEVKRPGEVQRPDQTAFEETVHNARAGYYVVHSIEEALRALHLSVR